MTKKKNDELQKLEQEHGEIKDLLQRTHAEFQNFQKRTEQEKKLLVTRASENLIRKILPVLDNLELALNNDHSKDDFRKGVEMIYAQLLDTLEQEGLKVIEATGKFNPELHEALLTEESDKPKNTITQELQKGYTLSGKVLRHTKVKISKGDKK